MTNGHTAGDLLDVEPPWAELSRTARPPGTPLRPCRIHEITCGFDIGDVWALPVQGGQEDLGLLAEMSANARRTDESSKVIEFTWTPRWNCAHGWAAPARRSRISDAVAPRVAIDLRTVRRDPCSEPDLHQAVLLSLHLPGPYAPARCEWMRAKQTPKRSHR